MKFVDNIMKNKNVLSNSYVLYATAIVSFLNILGFIQIGKMNIVLLYIIMAILTNVYTKNMVVVLGMPLIIINLVSYMGYNMQLEGMEEREDGNELDDLDASLKELNKKMGEEEEDDEEENDE